MNAEQMKLHSEFQELIDTFLTDLYLLEQKHNAYVRLAVADTKIIEGAQPAGYDNVLYIDALILPRLPAERPANSLTTPGFEKINQVLSTLSTNVDPVIPEGIPERVFNLKMKTRGDFYTACWYNFHLNQSETDPLIPNVNLDDATQRQAAWQEICRKNVKKYKGGK